MSKMVRLRIAAWSLFLALGLFGFALGGEPTDEPVGEPHKVVSQSPKAVSFGGGTGKVVVVVTLEGTVDMGIGPYLERSLDLAREKGAVAFIVEMNTPGGRVDAALQIRDVLLEAGMPTFVWIHREAISAGALIAFAFDYIVWSSAGSMGAATPIQLSGGEAEPVDEKMTSFMRSAMRATAEAKGRDGMVAEAMVDRNIDLPPYAKEGWLLTAAQSQARQLGLWDGDAESLEDLLAWAGLDGAEVIRPTQNWAEDVARFVTDPVVSSILMSIGVLGILIEFYTPGFGLAGIAGALSLLLFFAGHLVVRLAGWEELALALVGGVMLGLEILVIPGFGIAGVLGILALIGALILALVGVDFGAAWDAGILGNALFRVMASLGFAGATFVLMMRYLPSFKPVRKMVLNYSLRVERGVVALGQNAKAEEILGLVGVTLTDCRPVGKASLGKRKLDVCSQGEMIPKGTTVRVLGVEGPRIVVEVVPGPIETMSNGDA